MVTRFEQQDKVAVSAIELTQALGAMTSGTTYTGILQPAPILDSLHDGVAGFGNKSFSATGAVFTNEVKSADLVVANGDYYINYATGTFKVKAGASASPIASWYSKSLYISQTGYINDGLQVITSGDITITEDEDTKILYTDQAITVGNKVSKVLYLPKIVSALQIMVDYSNANRSVTARIFNSVDGIIFETTTTQEFSIVDEMQLVQFFDDQLSRFVKVEFECFTANCTFSAKARIIA